MPTGAFISKDSCKGRRYAISDIHGCFDTLIALLDKIKISREDHLYFLGDYINRGPKSKSVVEHLLEMKREGFQVFFLWGNHEALVSEGQNDDYDKLLEALRKFNSDDLLNANGNLNFSFSLLQEKMVHFIESEDYVMVHAGLNFTLDDPLKDEYAMLWSREEDYVKEKIEGKKLLHGHTPKTLEFILEQEEKSNGLWCIDAGCAYVDKSKGKGMGNLVAFDLDGQKFEVQPCIDFLD